MNAMGTEYRDSSASSERTTDDTAPHKSAFLRLKEMNSGVLSTARPCRIMNWCSE